MYKQIYIYTTISICVILSLNFNSTCGNMCALNVRIELEINNSYVIISPRQYRICVCMCVYMNTSHILNQAINDSQLHCSCEYINLLDVKHKKKRRTIRKDGNIIEQTDLILLALTCSGNQRSACGILDRCRPLRSVQLQY